MKYPDMDWSWKKYPIVCAGYTMESPNHITCGIERPLADDWKSPAECAMASNAAMKAVEFAQFNTPQPDILSRMDEWDEKYKEIFGDYPEFSRLFVPPPIAEFGLKDASQVTGSGFYISGTAEVNIKGSHIFHNDWTPTWGATPNYTTYEEVQKHPNAKYDVVYHPNDFTPRYVRVSD